MGRGVGIGQRIRSEGDGAISLHLAAGDFTILHQPEGLELGLDHLRLAARLSGSPTFGANAMHNSPTPHASHRARTLTNALLAGYLVAVSLLIVLWAGLYSSREGTSAPAHDLRRCAAMQDAAARLACFDHAASPDARLPGRGFAPTR